MHNHPLAELDLSNFRHVGVDDHSDHDCPRTGQGKEWGWPSPRRQAHSSRSTSTITLLARWLESGLPAAPGPATKAPTWVESWLRSVRKSKPIKRPCGA